MARKADYPLGGLVRRRRSELRLTQTELAERAGISQAYLSSMERGLVRMPDVEIRRRLAEALRMTHVQLLLDIEELSPAELGQTAPTPVVPGYQAKLDALPPESRRAAERIIDDIYEASLSKANAKASAAT